MLGGKCRAINIYNRKKKWMKSISKMNITGKAWLNGKKTNTGHKLLFRDRRWDITTYPIVIKG